MAGLVKAYRFPSTCNLPSTWISKGGGCGHLVAKRVAKMSVSTARIRYGIISFSNRSRFIANTIAPPSCAAAKMLQQEHSGHHCRKPSDVVTVRAVKFVVGAHGKSDAKSETNNCKKRLH